MTVCIEQRLKPDSIDEFRRAANDRFHDADRLFATKNRVGCIYLCGYVVEMLLKASFFTLSGFASVTPITPAHLAGAKQSAKSYGIPWQGNWHDLGGGSQLLVTQRRLLHMPYADPSMESVVLSHSRVVYHRWKEFIRYHRYKTFPRETERIFGIAAWFIDNQHAI